MIFTKSDYKKCAYILLIVFFIYYIISIDTFLLIPMFIFLFFFAVSSAQNYWQTKFCEQFYSRFTKKYTLIRDARGFLDGYIGDYHVIITPNINAPKPSVDITIRHTLGLYFDFSIKKETMLTTMNKKIGHEDMLTGDDEFDAKFLLFSQKQHLLTALLQYNVRKNLFFLVNTVYDFSIGPKITHLTITGNKYSLAIDADNALEYTVRILDEFNHPDYKKLLINNTLHDHNKQLSLYNFVMLLKNYDLDNDVMDTVKKAFRSEFIPLKIEAASVLGSNGKQYLMSILHNPQLVEEKYLVRTVDLISNTLTEKVKAALTGLYEEASKNVKLKILSIFKSSQDKTLTPFLIEQLSVKDREIRIKVIQALETCGTVAAVESLYSIGSNTFLTPHINKTIESIQSRVGLKESGHLSITGPDQKSGALSINEKAGGLSKIE